MKEVVLSADEATREVERLNLSASPGSKYYGLEPMAHPSDVWLDLWERYKWISYAMSSVALAIALYQTSCGAPNLDTLNRSSGGVTRIQFQHANPQFLVGLDGASVKESFWLTSWPTKPPEGLEALSYGDVVTVWHLKDGAYERLWQLEYDGKLLLTYEFTKALWTRNARKGVAIGIGLLIATYLFTRGMRWWVAWLKRFDVNPPTIRVWVFRTAGSLVPVAVGIWMIRDGELLGWLPTILFGVFGLLNAKYLVFDLLQASRGERDRSR